MLTLALNEEICQGVNDTCSENKQTRKQNLKGSHYQHHAKDLHVLRCRDID